MGKKNSLPPLLSFYRRNRRMPSYGELQRLLGYRSKTAAVKLAVDMHDGARTRVEGEGLH